VVGPGEGLVPPEHKIKKKF